MNTRPPAVTIGPPSSLYRPVFCLPAGRSSLTPRRVCQAMSPVLALMAISRPQGGRMQGRLTVLPLASLKPALKPV